MAVRPSTKLSLAPPVPLCRGNPCTALTWRIPSTYHPRSALEMLSISVLTLHAALASATQRWCGGADRRSCVNTAGGVLALLAERRCSAKVGLCPSSMEPKVPLLSIGSISQFSALSACTWDFKLILIGHQTPKAGQEQSLDSVVLSISVWLMSLTNPSLRFEIRWSPSGAEKECFASYLIGFGAGFFPYIPMLLVEF